LKFAVPNACNIQYNFIASFTGTVELLVSLMRTRVQLILTQVLLLTYFMHGVKFKAGNGCREHLLNRFIVLISMMLLAAHYKIIIIFPNSNHVSQ